MNTVVGILIILMLEALVIYVLFDYRRCKNVQKSEKKQCTQSSKKEDVTHDELPATDDHSEYRALRKLNPFPQYGEYLRFTNLIVESGYNTPYTEIDELIVSRFGIFCIEQKDNHGVILGKKHDQYWTQCMRNYRGKIGNPSRQNYKHRKALEKLLAKNLHSAIHTYSYFPKAYKVITDNTMLFTSNQTMWDAIRSHNAPLYTFEEVIEISKILAYESSRKEIRSPIHIATLKYYLASQQM